jgi:hypothetical protein
MKDILSLPYPNEEIEFDPIEKILLSDISVYYSEFRKLGEKSIVLDHPDKYDLETYGVLFCSILNSVYDAFKPLKPIVEMSLLPTRLFWETSRRRIFPQVLKKLS